MSGLLFVGLLFVAVVVAVVVAVAVAVAVFDVVVVASFFVCFFL